MKNSLPRNECFLFYLTRYLIQEMYVLLHADYDDDELYIKEKWEMKMVLVVAQFN